MVSNTWVNSAQITDIISQVSSSQVSNLSVSMSVENVNDQKNRGTGCKNLDVENSSGYTYATTSVFQDQETYQNTMAQIATQISNTVKEKTGFSIFPSFSNTDMTTVINNMLQNTLTSSVMDVMSSSSSAVNDSSQVCGITSTDGVNAFVGTTTAVNNEVYNLYSTNDTVQQTSANISNMVTSQLKEKTSSGPLRTIIVGFAVILALIVVTILIIAAILGIGVFASGFIGDKDSGIVAVTGTVSDAVVQSSENAAKVAPMALAL